MPNIIMLMGVSSSGKTTVAKEIQRMAENKYLLVGFDQAVESLDKKYWPGGSLEKEGFYYETIKTDKGEFPELRPGVVGEKFLSDMIMDIIAKANQGEDLIIDFVMSEEQHSTLIAGCKDATIVQIGIKPPLEEIIRRELARGDRKIGIAEAAYDSFYEDKKFDLIIDTSSMSTMESSNAILTILQSANVATPVKGK